MNQTEYAEKALDDRGLYQSIVEHREVYTYLSGIDYTSHFPPNLNPIPPTDLQDAWAKDYETMQKEMIYGDSLPFYDLIERIGALVKVINQLN